MEAIIKHSNMSMGSEILFFEEAEISKVKGDKISFAAMGPLSVLYFKDYHRFVLQLNDWKFPLLRRLPILASEKSDISSHTYILPAANGFTFHLKINKIHNKSSIDNLETILKENSKFSMKGFEAPLGKLEASPDDKLVRHIKKDTGFLEVASEVIKSGIEKVKVGTETLKSGTKHLTSTKKKVNLKDIKNKNFKKMAHSTFKKDFFESTDKLSKEFLELRKHNLNLDQTKSLDDLIKSSAPSHYIFKDDIEGAILDSKDLALHGNFHLSGLPKPAEKGFMDNLKQGLTDIKDAFAPRAVDKSVAGQGPMEAHGKAGLDSMTHYQG